MERVNPCFFPNFRISDSRPPNTYPVFNPPFPPIHHCQSLNYSQISSFQIPNFIFVSYLSVKNLHIYIYIYPLFPPQYSSLTPNYHPTEPYAAKRENPHSANRDTYLAGEDADSKLSFLQDGRRPPQGVGVLGSHRICQPISFHQECAAPVLKK
ncbi:hypothetical protein I3760_11G114400 [Carya illinoinensis]|nr:hypothetical protein I3760_11G114400 [Carya illinoinensis]